MPEGDTVHRVATSLRGLLVGTPLARVRIAGVTRAELAGTTVAAITPHGKHMMIDTANGWQLRVHLGMPGRWRRYRAPATAPAAASLVLSTATDDFACLNAPTVELTARRDPRRSRAVAALGPDLLADDFDPAVAVARARAAGATPIGVVLLDQRVAAGIGNVYKSEVLWLERQSPFTPTSALTDDQLTALYARARTLMRANLGPGARMTRTGPRGDRAADERTWVYGRARRACTRCGAAIVTALQGEQLRRTYYCPTCQHDPRAPAPPPPRRTR
ncbi:MAG TPA: DNA-formamidopyrimidine glycosylase family protein [Kofleriaceae bacterium]|nr:DNA-formamidopyrimidine glycosylase family protein [Kofleriaceae bacterium]